MSVELSSRISHLQRRATTAFPPSLYGNVSGLGRETALLGKLRTFYLREGLELGVFDLHAKADYSGTFATSPQLVIILVTEGHAGSIFRHPAAKSASSRLYYKAGEVIVACNQVPGKTTFCMSSGQKLSGIELRVHFDFLNTLSPYFLTTARTHCQAVQLIGGKSGWVVKLPWTLTLAIAARTIRTAARDRQYSLMLEGLSLCVLAEVLEAFETGHKQETQKIMGRYESRIREAATLLKDNPAEPWTIKILSQRIGLSEKRLKDGFQKYYQTGPYGFLKKLRLDHARDLLMSKTMTVTEVALQVGYSNSSHFSAIFRRAFGISPSKVPINLSCHQGALYKIPV